MSDHVLVTDALTADLGPDHTLPVATLGGLEVGLWAMAPGAAEDTEVDEVCLVLAGRGTVAFDDGEVVDLAPGVVLQLRAGEHTTWTVTETIRKVYVAR